MPVTRKVSPRRAGHPKTKQLSQGVITRKYATSSITGKAAGEFLARPRPPLADEPVDTRQRRRARARAAASSVTV